jgi:hypothetical protein
MKVKDRVSNLICEHVFPCKEWELPFRKANQIHRNWMKNECIKIRYNKWVVRFEIRRERTNQLESGRVQWFLNRLMRMIGEFPLIRLTSKLRVNSEFKKRMNWIVRVRKIEDPVFVKRRKKNLWFWWVESRSLVVIPIPFSFAPFFATLLSFFEFQGVMNSIHILSKRARKITVTL